VPFFRASTLFSVFYFFSVGYGHGGRVVAGVDECSQEKHLGFDRRVLLGQRGRGLDGGPILMGLLQGDIPPPPG
jgi:hypothetical protein